MKKIRILLINGQELIPCGVQGMLEQEEDMEIIGDYLSVEEALLQPETFSPNIVLMEVKTPGMDGIEITHRLHQKWPTCKVIMSTWHEDCLDEALETGVAGYLLKDIKCQELVQVIRRIYHGELVIDERLTPTPKVVEGESEYLSSEGDGSSILVKEAELVILLPIDTTRLLRFLYQLEETLEATIVQQVGSWNKGTTITILLRRATPVVDILDKVGKMPDVKDVIEEPAAGGNAFGFIRKIMTNPETSPKKELLVTLKQADTAKQLELPGLRKRSLVR